MIKDCNCCNKPPKDHGMISCNNDKCPEFGEEYYVWEWQALRTNKDIDNLTKLQECNVDT